MPDGNGTGPQQMEQLYTFRWGNNEARAALKGRTCRIVARAGRGGMNTVLVEFLDTGERVSTSLRALKRIKWSDVADGLADDGAPL